ATEVVRIVLVVVLVVAAPLMLAFHALPQTNYIAVVWWRSMAALLAVPVAQSLAFTAFMRLFFEGRLQYFGSWEGTASGGAGTVVQLGADTAVLAAHDSGGSQGVLLNLMLFLVMLYVQVR